MLFLLVNLAAATGTVPTVVRLPEPARPVRSCMPRGVTFAEVTARAQGFRRLGEEPAANQYLAVERNFGGCPVPAVVRTGIRR